MDFSILKDVPFRTEKFEEYQKHILQNEFPFINQGTHENKNWQAFSVNNQTILGPADCMASGAPAQLCCSMYGESHHRRSVKEWLGLCSNETLLWTLDISISYVLHRSWNNHFLLSFSFNDSQCRNHS